VGTSALNSPSCPILTAVLPFDPKRIEKGAFQLPQRAQTIDKGMMTTALGPIVQASGRVGRCPNACKAPTRSRQAEDGSSLRPPDE
jgi:hypothetical protein